MFGSWPKMPFCRRAGVISRKVQKCGRGGQRWFLLFFAFFFEIFEFIELIKLKFINLIK